MIFYGTRKIQYSLRDKYGIADDDSFKEPENMSHEELVDIVYALQGRIDELHAKHSATIETMNKFLAKDHEGVLDKILIHHDQTEK